MALNNRIIPESLQAEQAVLGSMLMEREAIAAALETLTPDDFYRELHRQIFAALESLFEKGQPADLVTTAQALQSAGQLESVGGFDYLSDLIQACPSSANVRRYAKTVLEKSELRAIIAAADRAQSLCYGDIESVTQLKADVEEMMLSAARDRSSGECVPVASVAVSVIATLENQIRNKGQMVGHSTGFVDLDRKMGGYRPNHLVILGARPGLGKSAFALQSAYAVAKSGVPALVFEFEMSKEELVQRLACSVARVGFQKMERGLLEDGEIYAVIQAAREIEQVPLFIQDTSEMTTFDMRSRARRIEAEHGPLGLIVVDYLQIIADEARRGGGGTRAETLGKIARQCHIMGGERDCTVLALAQLSREVERREDKRPILSDLRDSGSIEAEANRVLFLYRDGYYRNRETAEPATQNYGNGWMNAAAANHEDNVAEIIIAKNRNGPNGTVRLRWTGESVRFDNLAHGEAAA